jgi:hypothetical protein
VPLGFFQHCLERFNSTVAPYCETRRMRKHIGGTCRLSRHLLGHEAFLTVHSEEESLSAWRSLVWYAVRWAG